MHGFGQEILLTAAGTVADVADWKRGLRRVLYPVSRSLREERVMPEPEPLTEPT